MDEEDMHGLRSNMGDHYILFVEKFVIIARVHSLLLGAMPH